MVTLVGFIAFASVGGQALRGDAVADLPPFLLGFGPIALDEERLRAVQTGGVSTATASPPPSTRRTHSTASPKRCFASLGNRSARPR